MRRTFHRLASAFSNYVPRMGEQLGDYAAQLAHTLGEYGIGLKNSISGIGGSITPKLLLTRAQIAKKLLDYKLVAKAGNVFSDVASNLNLYGGVPFDWLYPVDKKLDDVGNWINKYGSDLQTGFGEAYDYDPKKPTRISAFRTAPNSYQEFVKIGSDPKLVDEMMQYGKQKEKIRKPIKTPVKSIINQQSELLQTLITPGETYLSNQPGVERGSYQTIYPEEMRNELLRRARGVPRGPNASSVIDTNAVLPASVAKLPTSAVDEKGKYIPPRERGIFLEDIGIVEVPDANVFTRVINKASNAASAANLLYQANKSIIGVGLGVGGFGFGTNPLVNPFEIQNPFLTPKVLQPKVLPPKVLPKKNKPLPKTPPPKVPRKLPQKKTSSSSSASSSRRSSSSASSRRSSASSSSASSYGGNLAPPAKFQPLLADKPALRPPPSKTPKLKAERNLRAPIKFTEEPFAVEVLPMKTAMTAVKTKGKIGDPIAVKSFTIGEQAQVNRLVKGGMSKNNAINKVYGSRGSVIREGGATRFMNELDK